jgi:hypothetical protein
MEYFQFKVYTYYFGTKRAAYMHVTFSELGQCNKMLSLQIPPIYAIMHHGGKH